MEFLSLILAAIALGVAILVYQRVGGVADLKKQIDSMTSSVDLKKSVDSLTATVETLREKTAEAIGKLEEAVRGEAREEKKPSKGAQAKVPSEDEEKWE